MLRNVRHRFSSALDSAPPSPPRPGPRGVVPPPLDLDATLPPGQGARSWPVPETLPMRCLRCQGTVERGTAPVRVDRDGYRLAWKQVPARISNRCALAYFEHDEGAPIRR